MSEAFEDSGETVYPEELKSRPWWVAWILDGVGRKRPVAPWVRGDAYPAKWKGDLPQDERPETDFKTAKRWVEHSRSTSELSTPDDVQSEMLDLGIIIPRDRPDIQERVTLIDWDDVRDPETAEVHPVVVDYVREYGGYVEISQSGKGLHQFVFGGLPGNAKKFIRFIDDEPFIGDDRPQVELYDGGRHTAMTGRHVDGTGTDVLPFGDPDAGEGGQAYINDLVQRFADAGNNSTDSPTNPTADDGTHTDSKERDPLSTDEVADLLECAEQHDYTGPNPIEWDIPEGRSLAYHAAVEAHYHGFAHVNFWRVTSAAAAHGHALGKSPDDVLDDLRGSDRDGESAGWGGKTEERVYYDHERAQRGEFHPPSHARLAAWGILPSRSGFWDAWAEARESGSVNAKSVIPSAALRHIAEERGFYNFEALPSDADTLPAKAHNKALYWVLNEWWDEEEEGEPATARNYKERDTAAVLTWEDVRYIYEDSSNRGREAARALLKRRYHFITLEGTDQLLVYNPETGAYSDRLGDVRGEVYDGLGEHWTTHELNEITAGLRQHDVVASRHLNGRAEFDDPHICVTNGVLNLFTGELLSHSPEYNFVDRVPHAWRPDADTKPYEEFMDDITGRDADAKAMMEMVGHALVPDAHERGWKKFLMMYGSSDNGKSFFYDRVSDLLNGADGEEGNVMNVKLAKLASNRFSKNSMYGHMANIAGEVDGKKIRNTADLKDITGGDSMEIEPKGGESFSDTMNTTLMFAANDPPIIGDRDKEAIATRIVPIELPYKFTDNPSGPKEKPKVPEQELKEELASPEALSALMKLAVAGVQRMHANHGDVSLPESPEERLKRYEGSADPMKQFGNVCLKPDTSDYLVKDDVTRIYKEFAADRGHEIGSNTHRTLHAALEYPDTRPREPDYTNTSLPLRPWEDRKHAMARVTLTDEGLEYAEAAGLVVDDGGETTDSDDETATFDGLGAGFNDVEDVTVAEKLEPADWQAGKGHVVDGDGSILPYVCEKTDPFADVREGDTVALQNVKVRDSNEGPTLVLSGVTRVENQTRAAGQSGLDSADTVADGGTDTATADNSADETDGTPDGSGGPTELVSVAIEAVEACVERGAADDPAKHGEVVSWITEHTDLTLHRADEAIDEAQTRGAIQAVADGEYRST